MDLKNIIDKKSDYADYMLDEITHICKDMDKRDPGSPGEKQACEYMADVLKKDCGCERVDVESFKENPGSFFGWIYFTITFVLAAIVLFFFCPIVSAILIVAGLTIVLLQFGFYKKCVDRFFPEKTGHNVTAVKKCSGEVKRRIFFNGHPDAAWEWPVNYALGGVGFEGHAVICGIGAVYYLVISIISTVKYGAFGMISHDVTLFKMALWGLIFVPFLIGLYWMWNKNRIVDGANDNLSGCYMGIAVLKALHDQGITLENTEVGVILSGSEEAGLRGCKSWAKNHYDEYVNSGVETVILCVDTLTDREYLRVYNKDMTGTVKNNQQFSQLVMDASKDAGHDDIELSSVFFGSSDAAAFSQAGITATCLAAMDPRPADYYHNRRDTADRLVPETIKTGFDVIISTILNFDEKGLN